MDSTGSVEPEAKPYSDILSIWRMRESTGEHGNKTARKQTALETSTVNDMPDSADDRKTPSGLIEFDARLEGPKSNVMRQTLPSRQRKTSAETVRCEETKHPLGYYGTMALINSRRCSMTKSLHGLELGLFRGHNLSSESNALLSRSWHFDRDPTSSPSSSMRVEETHRSETGGDNVDGQLSNSFSDIMERYKNAKKQIMSNKEQSPKLACKSRGSFESDSDSDIENMREMLIHRTDSFSHTKTDEFVETVAIPRKRRLGVTSPEASPLLKPIEESEVSHLETPPPFAKQERDAKPLQWSGNTDNFGELKALTSKMKLDPGLVSQYGLFGESRERGVSACKAGDTLNMSEGRDSIRNIHQALDYIRSELRNMHNDDQVLAKKLMYIRRALRDIRLQKSCEEYRSLLDDTENNISDVHTMDSVSSICEVPTGARMAPSLRSRGITKMNINARRFSVL